MNRSVRRPGMALATVALACSTLLIAAPAHAAPWDGSDVEFGPGLWNVDANYFDVEDVYLVFPDTSTEYTDIWDGAGETSIDASLLGVLDETVFCTADADVDVEVEAGTGDLVFTCVADNAAFATADLEVVSEIRVLVGGEIVRFVTTITNVGLVDATIDAVRIETDFGTSDFLYDYGNQSDGILAVPAVEQPSNYTALNTAEALWIVHWDEDDAPGGLVMGSENPATSGAWEDSGSSDEYLYSYGPFTVPAGESRSIVTFATWDPQTLIDGDYTNSPPESLVNDSADQVVAGMADFDVLDGVLANGIEDVSMVVNWEAAAAPEPEPEEPELADTGAGDVLAAGLAAVLVLGLGGVLVARRRATA